jgi:two-component system response regulator RstA
MADLLLVEDDAPLAELVATFLRGRGYTVAVEADGARAIGRILADGPDLVVLDGMLPGLDGLEVCRRAREQGFTGGIVMLTARGEDIDEVLGLREGADDYLAKPVRPRVLLARIEAVLRRLGPRGRAIDLGRLRVDPARRTATLDGLDLDLTTAELDLLYELAKRAGEVLDRDALSLALRGAPWDGVDRSIDLRVSRLRRKLGPDAADILKSVRGTGYLLVPSVR